MPISLSRLCENTEKSYQLRLIAGRDGLDNPVRWVHMIEDPEVTGFIHGNELVFTTGIRQRGVDWLLDFVVNLREHGAVGLVVNLGPYITSIPPQVIVYCEQNAFPLFTIPWEEHIIDVTYDFCHRIVLFGREVCTARRPYCERCCLAQLCPTGKKALAGAGC